MFSAIIINFFICLLAGFALEFFYRSFKSKKLIKPKFVNAQMYGFMGIFLVLIYSLNTNLTFKIFLIFIIPTLIEFLTGYVYFKTKRIRLWDYSKEKLNFMGIICLRFSLIWFIISAFYYYLVIPKF